MSLGDRIRKLQSKAPKRKWKLRPEILLCPNIPKPLHGVAPRAVLGAKWWNKTRQEAYKSTDYHCQACGVHKFLAEYHQWLEGHEIYRIDYASGISEYIETVPLCHYCHNYIHDGRLKMLLDSGKLHHAKYRAIIQHGDRVLKEAGLSRPTHNERCATIENGPLAEWGKWRLLLNGKKYKPRFRSYDEWLAHFDKENDDGEEA